MIPEDDADACLAWWIIVATIPVGLPSLALEHAFRPILAKTVAVCFFHDRPWPLHPDRAWRVGRDTRGGIRTRTLRRATVFKTVRLYQLGHPGDGLRIVGSAR